MKFGSPMTYKNAKERRLRHCATVFMMLVVFSAAYLAHVPYLFSNPAPQATLAQESEQEEVRQALSIAEAKHELVKVLITQGRYDRVLPELRTILDLKLPDRYEANVAKSACIIANDLAESKQYALAHSVLDETMRHMKGVENKVSILKIQAFIYKAEGNLDMALQYLERAIELEKQRNR